MTALRVAAAQYPLDRPDGWDAWAGKLDAWVGEAARLDAQILVLPEYAGLELVGLLPDSLQGDLAGQLPALQELLPRALDLWAGLARRHRVHLLAGSVPVAADGGFRNRAHLFGPDGGAGFQDKLMLTRFERQDWGLAAGSGTRVFDLGPCRAGICICYDAEFPWPARAQAEAGAELLLVPSCTDSPAGQNRVRVGARARALENQLHAVHAPMVGEAAWCPAADVNVGAAAVYAPPDRGLPDDGIVAAGEPDRPCWLLADIDLELTRELRRSGPVPAFHDWPAAWTAAPVETLR